MLWDYASSVLERMINSSATEPKARSFSLKSQPSEDSL